MITAVFIVAIVATVSAYISLGQQVWMRQAQTFLDRSQASKVNDGALQWAILILDEDRKKNPGVDDQTEDWANPLPPIPVDGGTLIGKIEDAQAKFNLNSLVRAPSGGPGSPGGPGAPGAGGSPGASNDAKVFRRLMTNLRVDPNLVDAVIDWIDADSNESPGGAEDLAYSILQPPYRAANQPMSSVDELRLVRGFTPEIVEKLRPHVTALPTPTEVNINTCTPELLSSLFNTLTPQQAGQLTGSRPFKDKAELETKAGEPPINLSTFDVKSQYYVVNISTKFGRLTSSRDTLVYRPPSGPLQVVWKARKLLLPEAPPKEG